MLPFEFNDVMSLALIAQLPEYRVFKIEGV